MERERPIRVKKSSKEFKRLFQLANDLAIAKNPQRWFNTAAPDRADYIPEEERLAVVEAIEKEMELELIRSSVPWEFREFIEEKLHLSLLDKPYR